MDDVENAGRPPRPAGIWSFATITPLQRPDDLASKQVLTDEETASLEQRAAKNRIDRPPRLGDTGAFNQFWIDRGTKVVPTKQSSLIVDPLDGKLPNCVDAILDRRGAHDEDGGLQQ